MKEIQFTYQKAFTLVELVVTILVATVVISIAVPSFTNLIESSKARTTRDLLVSSIHLAKEKAQTKRVDVYLCATDDSETCSESWGGDWLVYEDSDGSASLTSDDLIISNVSSKTLAIVSSSEQISFTPTGHSSSNTFQVCDNTDNSVSYQIELSRMGRISYSSAEGDCDA